MSDNCKYYLECFIETTLPFVFPSYNSCFIGETGVFFGAFLGPIFAVMIFNAVIFVIVIVVLFRHTKKRYDRSGEHKDRKMPLRFVISIIGITVLFGLTWLFGAFTIAEASTAFQVLFVLSNAFQGFYIFLFFVVISKDARELWLKVLFCGKEIPGISVSTSESRTPRRPGRAGTSGSTGMIRGSRPTVSTGAGSTGSELRAITFGDSMASVQSVMENPHAELGVIHEEDQSNFEWPANDHPQSESNPADEESVDIEQFRSSFSRASRTRQESGTGTEQEGPGLGAMGGTTVGGVRIQRQSTREHHVERAELDVYGDSDDSDSGVLSNPNADRD